VDVTKNYILVLFFLVLICPNLRGQDPASKLENYKRVKIQNMTNNLDRLHSSGIDLSCGAVIKD